MIICNKCKTEMKCVTTGIVCVWNKSHCYSGDEFECQACNNTIIITSSASFFDPKILNNKDIKTINMEKKD